MVKHLNIHTQSRRLGFNKQKVNEDSNISEKLFRKTNDSLNNPRLKVEIKKINTINIELTLTFE
ncbi:hypothetical protein VIS19158_09952 [Vibrio scophthalmi LMG 19158]|uniref:Uncharacterized protein n=1 Tax=Vibrio scophthalmi LMG 19158 TaxID=870967 RepID=F9RR30_9VIBR|nr:hypothetical protein VIS19158_09952 [Vibrio scophthalmi LMG 19158]